MQRRAILQILSGAAVRRRPRPADGMGPGAGRGVVDPRGAPGARRERQGPQDRHERRLPGTVRGTRHRALPRRQVYYTEITSAAACTAARSRCGARPTATSPTPCIKNTIELVEKEQVFFLSNYVGTPTLTPCASGDQALRDRQMILVGNFTGAQLQREEPYVEQVSTSGPRTGKEMLALVDRFWQTGARKFGVYYRSTPTAAAGPTAWREARAARSDDRGRGDVCAQLRQVRRRRESGRSGAPPGRGRRGPVHRLLSGCGAFVRTARIGGWTVPISNVSFVGSEAMLSSC